MNGSVTIEGHELVWRANGKIIRQRANHLLRGQWPVDVPFERRQSLYQEIEARFPGWQIWDTPRPAELAHLAEALQARNSERIGELVACGRHPWWIRFLVVPSLIALAEAQPLDKEGQHWLRQLRRATRRRKS